MNRLWLVPLLALAGLAASPSNASAHFFFRWCHPEGGWYGGRWAYPAPQYYVVPVPIPQFYYVPVPPPQVVPGNAVIPKAKPTGSPRSDAPPRSAPMVTITPGMPVELDPGVKPAAGDSAIPSPAPAPMGPLTIPDPMVPKAPPKVVPETPPLTIPDPKTPAKVAPETPPLTIPDPMVPKGPPKAAPEAKPMPAPAGQDTLPLIPLPEPRKAPKGSDGKDDLPPLVLPPEGTGTSSGVIPPTTVKSSPLTGAIKVQVFAAAGSAAGTLRKVGFFNHTDRDLDLVIEGKSVKLPKKSYLNAELPAKFTWKAAGGEANATTVPDGAAGVDVLFKE